MKVEVEEVVCDWGVYEGGELKLILNSRSAAEQIADIIVADEYRHATDIPLRTALEKQIPKKLPVIDELYHCPSCGEMGTIMQGDNYCFNCGQALDWGDTE